MIITAYIKHYDSIEMREIKESFAFLADYDTKKKILCKNKKDCNRICQCNSSFNKPANGSPHQGNLMCDTATEAVYIK